ncbi:hypothetical protein GIB67_003741 [Kingdonia uniflora]|uniref:Uncharacterized protein n=1 Tax=Kingdonia uniflora TaxID=39325 RepID=A0A7J7MSF0_9MAGN|nr:hypothetical protein GIB67_003741 [Kingdonia uniflora]
MEKNTQVEMSLQRHTYSLFKFNRGSLQIEFVYLSSISLPWLVVERVEYCCSLQLGFGGA